MQKLFTCKILIFVFTLAVAAEYYAGPGCLEAVSGSLLAAGESASMDF